MKPVDQYVQINANTWVLRRGRTDAEITKKVNAIYGANMPCKIVKPAMVEKVNPAVMMSPETKREIMAAVAQWQKSGRRHMRQTINLTVERAAEISARIAAAVRQYKMENGTDGQIKPSCGRTVEQTRRTEWDELVNVVAKQFNIADFEITVI